MDIQPVTMWSNGRSVQATQLNNILVWDNLIDSATFFWQVKDASGNTLQEGNTTMTGADYANWNTTTDINLAAFQFVAAGLNLTLV